MATIAQIISYAKVSQELAANAIAKQNAFGKFLDSKLPRKLYIERKSVETIYDLDSSYTGLTGAANYLLKLCGALALEAQSMSGGSGSPIPINPSTKPSPIQFTVDASSFMATGDTTKVFPSEWQGYDLLFFRAHVPQATNTPDFGTYYSWDKTTATLVLLAAVSSPTVNPAAAVGEEFQFFAI